MAFVGIKNLDTNIPGRYSFLYAHSTSQCLVATCWASIRTISESMTHL